MTNVGGGIIDKGLAAGI